MNLFLRAMLTLSKPNTTPLQVTQRIQKAEMDNANGHKILTDYTKRARRLRKDDAEKSLKKSQKKSPSPSF